MFNGEKTKKNHNSQKILNSNCSKKNCKNSFIKKNSTFLKRHHAKTIKDSSSSYKKRLCYSDQELSEP